MRIAVLTLTGGLALAGCSEHSPATPARALPSDTATSSPIVEPYDQAEQIEQLRQLRARGLLTEEEFEAKRKRVLERK